jgi:Resolvase, N terminal domain
MREVVAKGGGFVTESGTKLGEAALARRWPGWPCLRCRLGVHPSTTSAVLPDHVQLGSWPGFIDTLIVRVTDSNLTHRRRSGGIAGRGQRVGYIRVSSVGQNPARQLDGVELDRVFTDTVSGKSAARPQLQAMLTYIRDGDTVIVHSMDRLARNLDDLRRLVPDFRR